MKRQRSLVMAALVAVISLVAVPAASAQSSSSPAVVRDGNHWLLRDSLSGGAATESFKYGRTGDTPLLCDWNGDGTATPGIVREQDDRTRWMIRNSRTGGAAQVAFTYGRPGDRAVCGDWNGNGVQTPGIVRERADGVYVWHLRNSLSGGAADLTFAYGRNLNPGELPPAWPVVGDWNGDGTDTVGMVRGYPAGQMQWLLRNSNSGGAADHSFWYYDGGIWGDHLEMHVPVVGDWNGDGRYGPGVARASDGANPQWLLRNDRSAGTADHVFRYGRHLDLVLTWD